ncbi:MAG: DegQ family serine endoprotease [Calditrichaeota bacterium]|nr:DegQ family serine endoprotease [Calditrichota bacterium]MCB9088105.1 DegQ family serine endoprotease [Calditrichia bacterium]
MNPNQISQHKWTFILAGMLIGLFIAAGFEFTHEGRAQSLADNSSQNVAAAPAKVDPNALNIAGQLSDAFAAVAQQVNPSVVTVFTETDVKAPTYSSDPFRNSPFGQFFGDDFFQKFFQTPRPQGDMKQMGLGSGVIIDKDGIILTNNHVVDGADNIKVRLIDGREFEAQVKGRDPQTDLAVITIKTKDLRPIQIGNSDQMRVGDWVLAIGSPLNPQLEHTVTSGIVSAKGRSAVGLSQYEDYIQTDAAINPGNSGGALVNLRGELIGINSAIATRTGGFMGIGFAIPVNLAEKVSSDILEKGKVERGWLGVYIQQITPEIAKALDLKTTKGVIVSEVQENSPAHKAGLKEGDVILTLNGQSIDNPVELSTRIAGTSPGGTVNLKVLRNGKEKDVEVKLGELNPETQQLAHGEASHPAIGLTAADITPELLQKYQLPAGQKGVIISEVAPNGIAARAGIQVGDVVVRLNREAITSVKTFNSELERAKPGDNILFYIKRGGNSLFIAFELPEN